MIIYESEKMRVYKLRTARTSCFVIRTGNTAVLWDTSMAYERRTILKEFTGLNINKLDAVFVSHSHTDHAANVDFFSKKFDCPVYVHGDGIRNIKNGRCQVPRGTNLSGKIINWLSQTAKPIYNFESIAACSQTYELTGSVVEKYLGDNAELLFSPGHSPDSVSLVIDGKIALVGDVFVNMFMQFYPPFADNPDMLLSSWKLLSNKECEWYYPGHGGPVSLKMLNQNIKKLKEKR